MTTFSDDSWAPPGRIPAAPTVVVEPDDDSLYFLK